MQLLTIIYSNKVENLLKFKPRATHWMPSNSQNIYQLGNTICTTKELILEMVKILINHNHIPSDKVIYILANANNESVAYTFDSKGNFNNFFRI